MSLPETNVIPNVFMQVTKRRQSSLRKLLLLLLALIPVGGPMGDLHHLGTDGRDQIGTLMLCLHVAEDRIHPQKLEGRRYRLEQGKKKANLNYFDQQKTSPQKNNF